MTSASFVSGNRSIGLNQFHLEWCPKYRKNFMQGQITKAVETSLIQTAAAYKIIIHTLHVGPDHSKQANHGIILLKIKIRT